MNITDGINSRFENAGKSEFEDIAIETTQWNREKKDWRKYEQSTSELCNTFKWPNIGVIGVFKGQEREQGTEKNIFEEIMFKIVLPLMKIIYPLLQET